MSRPRKSPPLDQIIHGDARRMRAVGSNSVQLIITSPNYNAGIKYDICDDARTLETYLADLKRVWRECHRVLVRGGRICVNVANIGRKPYLDLDALISLQLKEIGFLMRGKIIWDKGPSAGISTAWGSAGMASASNPVLRDTHEYILVYCKDSFRLENTHSLISGNDTGSAIESTLSIWRIQAERRAQRKIKHPCPFPLDLPKRLIKLYTNEQDIVLDPFIGSGSTAVAAVEARRHFIGYDLSPQYCVEARGRVARAIADMGENAIQSPENYKEWVSD